MCIMMYFKIYIWCCMFASDIWHVVHSRFASDNIHYTIARVQCARNWHLMLDDVRDVVWAMRCWFSLLCASRCQADSRKTPNQNINIKLHWSCTAAMPPATNNHSTSVAVALRIAMKPAMRPFSSHHRQGMIKTRLQLTTVQLHMTKPVHEEERTTNTT